LKQEKVNVVLLATGQATMMTGQTLMLTAAPIIGLSLTDNPALVTLPVALAFLAMLLTSLPAALLMKHIGRRAGFLIGTVLGILGSLLAAYAIWTNDFVLFCAGLAVNGMLSGFGTYYRFAAADAAGPEYRARAISYVLTGGVVAAMLGPNLANWTKDAIGGAPFTASYLSVIAIYAVALIALAFVRIPTPTAAERRSDGRSYAAIARQPAFVVAAIGAMLGYGVMSLVMMSTPLAMHDHGHPFGDTAFVIQWHILGMFAPSFVTGRLIARHGALTVMLWGALLCGVCVAINLASTGVWALTAALMLLGVGWNFLFIGGTTLLTETIRPEEKAKTEGMNDFLILAVVTTVTFSAGALHHHLGWALVNVAVLPLLAVISAAVFWLKRYRRTIVNVANPEALRE
jgi:MFS family permease